jgi:hypothetical protein
MQVNLQTVISSIIYRFLLFAVNDGSLDIIDEDWVSKWCCWTKILRGGTLIEGEGNT